VIGGLAALGRTAALQALDSLFSGAEQLFGPEAVSQAIGPDGLRAYFKRSAVALGVQQDGIIPSDAEAQADGLSRTACQQLAGQLGPEAIQTGGKQLDS
jgi:hypothetical protein